MQEISIFKEMRKILLNHLSQLIGVSVDLFYNTRIIACVRFMKKQKTIIYIKLNIIDRK